jgi:hypothetical protein
MRWSVIILFGFGLAARGQNITITTVNNAPTAFNQAACNANDQIQFQWTSAASSTICPTTGQPTTTTTTTGGNGLPSSTVNFPLYISIAGPGASCITTLANGEAPPTCPTDVLGCPQEVNSGTPATFALHEADFFQSALGLDGGVGTTSSCPANQDINFQVCMLLDEPASAIGSTIDNYIFGSLAITYESIPPNPPTISGIVGGDQRLVVSWTTSVSLPQGYSLSYAPAPAGTTEACPVNALGDGGYDYSGGDGGVTTVTVAPTATKYEIDGVSDDVAYYVWMTVTDPAGNTSGDSAPCVGIPRKVDDFCSMYVAQGGKNCGGVGCGYSSATASAVVLVPTLLAPVLLAARRRKRR